MNWDNYKYDKSIINWDSNLMMTVDICNLEAAKEYQMASIKYFT